MAVKTISFTLSPPSIGKAIKELQAYRMDFQRKCEKLRQLVAERIQWSASEGFSSAMVSDVVEGNPSTTNDVSVTVEGRGNVSVVIANGSQAIFIEFGAGVYHNGAVGSSPHPWGAELGYLIGTYGKGKGKYDVWSYYDNGSRVYTMGTPAAMPMYNGLQEAIAAFDGIVREVFG